MQSTDRAVTMRILQVDRSLNLTRLCRVGIAVYGYTGVNSAEILHLLVR